MKSIVLISFVLGVSACLRAGTLAFWRLDPSGVGVDLSDASGLKALGNSYIIFELNRFSNKAKERIKSPKKFYIVDNGFVLSKS
ncbi:MAG: hypothetical protein PHU80_07200, partial [Kiritimatiellae bacterium]|nr:hypothetical protein [Kiritimatiellia bacterium]